MLKIPKNDFKHPDVQLFHRDGHSSSILAGISYKSSYFNAP